MSLEKSDDHLILLNIIRVFLSNWETIGSLIVGTVMEIWIPSVYNMTNACFKASKALCADLKIEKIIFPLTAIDRWLEILKKRKIPIVQWGIQSTNTIGFYWIEINFDNQ